MSHDNWKSVRTSSISSIPFSFLEGLGSFKEKQMYRNTSLYGGSFVQSQVLEGSVGLRLMLMLFLHGVCTYVLLS